MSQSGLARISQGVLPPTVPTTFIGDVGTATPAANAITIYADRAANNSGATVKFVNSGSISTLDLTDTNFNTIIGQLAGTLTMSGGHNTALGYTALTSVTSGDSNVSIGYASCFSITSGSSNTVVGFEALEENTSSSFNVAIGYNSMGNLEAGNGNNVALGYNSLWRLFTGDNNISLGTNSGSFYQTNESSNITIGNIGVALENNVIRIGTQGSGSAQQNACYIAGIIGVTASNPELVTINSSTSQMGIVTPANKAVLTTGATGTPVLTALATNGQLIIGSTAGIPAAATITAGAGITITNGNNSITIAATGSGFSWTDVTGATQTIAAQSGYVTDHTNVTYTLPASGALGDTFVIVGKLGITTIAQNANQQILMGSSSSTVGVGGSVAGTNVGDSATFVCITAGASTVWRSSSFVGNWSIT